MSWATDVKRRQTVILLISLMLIVSLGCEAHWSVSDEKAVRLVKEFYLFFHEGRDVGAKIIRREPYSEECSCYPINFRITSPGAEDHYKMFYFFRNKDGKIEVSEFRSLVK